MSSAQCAPNLCGWIDGRWCKQRPGRGCSHWALHEKAAAGLAEVRRIELAAEANVL
ncbi:hypothetical protein Alg130_00823 [Pyrenophora tritici-repentis]|uniref:Uncharacterized protein n=1 Tax=Pyrenophora tritici-repentis TaxID=45151 RepID=A0A2W1HBT3_9PLEO|nr:hypothetical protein PtrV1_01563 [Pyrenophora tritici-repentis]KAF7454300.1 hypothetical protein A1F99_015580 [Pyrenophora tritici-repentis]KAF7577400.1 hypothetical protein PtrM4_016400 [Pyrenophora tritici-repentis]KAI0584864.1 hypothetical protein Alg215_02848 [Pyrenophora tritici-repentis]KAI0591942.1 hypothetical protein Alg130_00823 [Pyrenophora tritici-repentis]